MHEEIRLPRSPKFDFACRHFEINCTWQPCRVYVTSFRPTRNRRESEKSATDLLPSKGQQCIFSNRLSTSLGSFEAGTLVGGRTQCFSDISGD